MPWGNWHSNWWCIFIYWNLSCYRLIIKEKEKHQNLHSNFNFLVWKKGISNGFHCFISGFVDMTLSDLGSVVWIFFIRSNLTNIFCYNKQTLNSLFLTIQWKCLCMFNGLRSIARIISYRLCVCWQNSNLEYQSVSVSILFYLRRCPLRLIHAVCLWGMEFDSIISVSSFAVQSKSFSFCIVIFFLKVSQMASNTTISV